MNLSLALEHVCTLAGKWLHECQHLVDLVIFIKAQHSDAKDCPPAIHRRNPLNVNLTSTNHVTCQVLDQQTALCHNLIRVD